MNTISKVFCTEFNKTYIVTSITETRVNMDDPCNKYTSSTGRSSSKHYLGKKTFFEYIKTGRYKIID